MSEMIQVRNILLFGEVRELRGIFGMVPRSWQDRKMQKPFCDEYEVHNGQYAK
jgi:hypothetical protein